jgi:hypothetical protein
MAKDGVAAGASNDSALESSLEWQYRTMFEISRIKNEQERRRVLEEFLRVIQKPTVEPLIDQARDDAQRHDAGRAEERQSEFPHRSREELQKMLEAFLDSVLEDSK